MSFFTSMSSSYIFFKIFIFHNASAKVILLLFGINLAILSTRLSLYPKTLPISRTAARGCIVPNVTICETCFFSVFMYHTNQLLPLASRYKSQYQNQALKFFRDLKNLSKISS